MNKKILVLGVGMAGHVIACYLREEGFDVSTVTRSTLSKKYFNHNYKLDVINNVFLNRFLHDHDYDIIINCIGILIGQSERRKDVTSYINSYFPHQLEERFKDTKTKIIHLSTDCVFSGHHAPYNEDSEYDGQSFYDRSKALGEIINDKDLTFRMSIVGPDMKREGEGLFNWFCKQQGEVFGYTRTMWNGITTIELAHGIKAAIEQNLTGLYHLVPERNISKSELLKLFKEIFDRKDMEVLPVPHLSLDKTLVNNRTDFDFKVQNYERMLIDMRSWIRDHYDLYPHYAGMEYMS